MRYSKWTWWGFYALLIGVPTIPNHGWQGVIAGITLGLYWALFTPVILRIVSRHPFSRAHWPKPALLHVLFMLVSAMATTVLDVIIVAIHAWPAVVDIELNIGQSIAVTIPIYLGITAVATIVDSQLRLAAVQRDAAEARLQALRTQLNPHFLFNALNTVAMAVRRADRQEALAVVLDLSTLLRTVLRRTNTELVRLDDELEFIEHYLDIEKIRFRCHVQTEWEIEPRARNAAVPVMILQPLVENALRHGVRERAQASRIRFSAAANNGTLEIAVEDDGPGFPAEWREGVGLANVRKRLALLFAERARLHIERAPQGASVRLSVPFTELPEHGEVQDSDRR
jgi:glucose-6-phosphate-specific signal transduction histidine kinase